MSALPSPTAPLPRRALSGHASSTRSPATTEPPRHESTVSGSPAAEPRASARQASARPAFSPGALVAERPHPGFDSRANRHPRRGPDVALAILVIAVVGLMVIPLPTFLLDILLAANLSAAVAVLLVVLYVPDALGIATFPTLLLLTTLFRLSLNVASTRLILLQANAGEIIRAFGQFVVRGNYVVGAVIFLILTIIQLVVVAKGSERVAEVGARFVLDAMPGKQMAIDAEVRSGAIDGREAQRRRLQLARESQFYGAMDGAMKFVKGDAIASIIITLVNLLGGLAIGVGQRGLAAGEALRRYGLLTIGDGLVTQIPALVLSTAAGILATRVASEQPDSSLGIDLSEQLLRTPRALGIASFLVIGLATVPGLPLVPFLSVGVLLWLASRARVRTLRAGERHEADDGTAWPEAPRAGDRRAQFIPVVVPWSLDISADLAPLLDDERRRTGVERKSLRAALQEVRERLFLERGVPLPAGRIRVLESLPDRRALLSIYEVPARAISLPAATSTARHVDEIAEQTFAALDFHAADFVGLAETQQLLDELERIAPAIVRQAVPKPVSLPLLAEVLRRLAEERVSIRDLRAILQALLPIAATEKDPLHLTEHVRAQLRRSITFRLTQGAGELGIFLLDPAIEETIRHAITQSAAGSFLALAPAAARDVVTAVQRAITDSEAGREMRSSPTPRPTVILTQPDVRRFVRKLLETDLPDVQVLSFADLLPEIALLPLGKATLAGLG